jgi:hypothetical protein
MIIRALTTTTIITGAAIRAAICRLMLATAKSPGEACWPWAYRAD